MAFFKNPHDVVIAMQFGDDPVIVVEPGAVVEVADKWAALVAERGVRVVPCEAPADPEPEPVEPEPEIVEPPPVEPPPPPAVVTPAETPPSVESEPEPAAPPLPVEPEAKPSRGRR